MYSDLKWAIYARKSSESSERQIQSIPDQLKIFNDIASKLGVKIIDTITDEKSAKKPGKRTGFLRLIKRIEKGEINAILCWRLNRLARNPEEGGKIAQLLQNGTIRLIKTNEREYDPNYNMLLLAVELGMATEESRELAKGIARGVTSKAESGWYPSVAPIGYKNTKTGIRGLEKIVVDKQRFPLVRKMWDLMLTGNYTLSDIHRIARDEWGLTTLKGRKSTGKPISLSTLSFIFQNIFYTGTFKFWGKIYAGKHKSMISVSEFERVQVLLNKKVQARRIKHDFPYTGIVKCAGCGSSITASEKTKRLVKTGGYKKYTYYHCSRRLSNGVCTAPPVTLVDFEQQITSYLKTFSIGDEFFELGLRILETSIDIRTKEREAISEQLQENVRILQNKRSKLAAYLLNETINEADYAHLKQEIDQQLVLGHKQLEQANDEIKAYSKSIINGFHFCRKAINTFTNADTKTKRAILNHLGSNQTLNDKKLCIITPKWLRAIKEGEELYFKEKERFELKKTLSNKDKLDKIDSFHNVVLNIIQRSKGVGNSTIFEDVPYINLDYSGNEPNPPHQHDAE